jgi:toxin-antitoxin system PIN domain toxin
VRALFDVNVLIALLQPHHIHFERAHAWWEVNRPQGWASCPLTQNGFVRIVTQTPSLKRLTVSEAIDRLQELTSTTDHEFWPDDVTLLDAGRFERARILGPKQLTDIYLLGLAVNHGGRLATFDRAIPSAAVHGAPPQHLAVI